MSHGAALSVKWVKEKLFKKQRHFIAVIKNLFTPNWVLNMWSCCFLPNLTLKLFFQICFLILDYFGFFLNKALWFSGCFSLQRADLSSHTVLFCSWYDNSFRGDGATGPCGSHLLSPLCAPLVCPCKHTSGTKRWKPQHAHDDCNESGVEEKWHQLMTRVWSSGAHRLVWAPIYLRLLLWGV